VITTTFITILIVLFLLCACTQGIPKAPSPTPSSGIEGQVSEGPMCPGPVAVGDTKCQDQPFQATIAIMDVYLKPITQFQTDASGLFKIPLNPGTYILHPKSDNVLPHAADQSVIVVAGQFTQVTIMYDTGMR
jgi:hypothetical protein